MGFINTRGAYPSRTMMLYQKFGNSSNANTMSLNSENFQNLPIAMKYELVAFVNYTLDNLQDEIDAAIKKQAEAPSTPQPEPING
jgi:single-stranded DNA-specific DHH superfamily exonuclease